MAEDVFRVLSWSVPGRGSHEARSAGTRPDPGSRPLIRGDLDWADFVCVMESEHEAHIRQRWPLLGHKVRVFGIPDVYMPGDSVLWDLLSTHILSLLAEHAPDRARSG